MSSGLAWLNDLMLWLGKWFPRLVLVKATHVGVKYSRAGRVVALAPGLYCYWPITSDVTLVSTRRRTTEIAGQLLDEEIVSITIAYTITEPVRTVTWCDDVFSLLDDRAQAHLSEAYEAAATNEEISDVVLGALRSEFEEHGVGIHTVNVIQRGWVFPLKNLNDWAQHAKAEL
jgi:hypothetical protein